MPDFPSTQWSFVTELRSVDAPGKPPLIEKFLLRYLPPMRSFVRYRFIQLNEHDCEDLLQDFVTDQIIQRSLVEWAERGRGKLRSFLSRSLQNYGISWLRRHRVKSAATSVETDSWQSDANTIDAETDIFDVAWCRHVIGEAVVRLKDECHDSGRQLMWDVFDLRVLRPLITTVEPLPYRELEAKLGAGEKQLANLLTSAKLMLRRKIEDIVQTYVEDPVEVKKEIDDLFQIAATCSKVPVGV